MYKYYYDEETSTLYKYTGGAFVEEYDIFHVVSSHVEKVLLMSKKN